MSAFEEALWLSGDKWIESFSTDLPEHKFSERHSQIMDELIYGKQTKVKFKLSKKTLKVLLIAAILLAFATTVFAIPASREYIITKFSNHSEYNVTYNGKVKEVDSLIVNYVPDGFEKVEDYGYVHIYKNGNKEIVVEKNKMNASIGYNTEKYEDEIIKIGGIDAVYYYRTDNDYKGIIFNDGNFIFCIDGYIEKEELVKIAQNIE